MKSRLSGIRWIVSVAVLAVVLTACAPNARVRKDPLKDQRPQPTRQDTRPAPAPPTRAGDYVVARGDTLYGIAFRHGLDYRDVARRNQIAPPYTIYPGQTLRLGTQSVASSGSSSRRPQGSSSRSSGSGLIAQTATDSGSPQVTNNATTEPGSRTPAPPLTTIGSQSVNGGNAVATPGSSGTPPAPPANVPPPTAALPSGPVRWQWPASGQTVVTFLAGDPTRQGIGIAGSNGQSVQAAGDGVVVYSGAGLIGYGELVIIKHSDEWLSAYGHNRKRLVSEGQAVRAGEQIAEMGRSGASRDMLHFEIRRKGKPVDPLGLLPRR